MSFLPYMPFFKTDINIFTMLSLILTQWYLADSSQLVLGRHEEPRSAALTGRATSLVSFILLGYRWMLQYFLPSGEKRIWKEI